MLLKKSFFLVSLSADLNDINRYTYSEKLLYIDITSREVKKAILQALSNKTSKSNKVSNLTLHTALSVLLLILLLLFNVYMHMRYCSKHFWESITITLHKLSKDNYSNSKLYCLIALLNIIRKTLKKIIAVRIKYTAEQHYLLSSSHFKAQKAKFIEHVIHLLLKRIYKAWVSNKSVVLVLLLNVLKAFNNVSHSRLVVW